jgi:hypothetical protein
MQKRMTVSAALEHLRTNKPQHVDAFVFLLHSKDRRVLDALTAGLDDPDERFRADVGAILGGRAERYDLLLTHLRDEPSPDIRLTFLRAIGFALQPSTVEAYLIALRDSNEEVVYAACIKVCNLPKDVSDAWWDQIATELRRLLDHSSWRVRWFACALLYHIGRADHQVVATLETFHQQPEATQFNKDMMHHRKSSGKDHETLPWLFTTEQLVLAAKKARIGGE